MIAFLMGKTHCEILNRKPTVKTHLIEKHSWVSTLYLFVKIHIP